MKYISRHQKKEVERRLENAAAVVILGQRQVGKTTLAEEIAKDRDADYLNLRDPQVQGMLLNKRLREHIEETGKHLTILDEIQARRNLYAELMTIIDGKRRRGEGIGCFLLIGSGSRYLANKSKESLRGRVSYVHLDPLMSRRSLWPEELDKLWLRGGLPAAFSADRRLEGL